MARNVHPDSLSMATSLSTTCCGRPATASSVARISTVLPVSVAHICVSPELCREVKRSISRPASGVRGSTEALHLTSSSIGSQDLRRSQQKAQQPSSQSSRSVYCVAQCHTNTSHTPQSAEINVGALMQPDTGAWANRTSNFSVPFKPLGLKKNQAPLVTAQQDAHRLTLRTNRLGNLRSTQALVFGVHDFPFTTAPAVAAQPSIQSLNKGRRFFPKASGQSSMREIIGRDGRSPVPTPRLSTDACDRPCPVAATFLNPEGRIPNEIFDGVDRDSLLSPKNDRRCMPNKKDRNCAGGSISIDLPLARMFLS
jgi:hypothetical protein